MLRKWLCLMLLALLGTRVCGKPLSPLLEITSGNGQAFVNVTGAACDARGRTYVACGKTEPIQVFDCHHELVDSWGRGILRGKHGIRLCGNALWITDTLDHVVVKFDLEGNVLKVLGVRGVPGADGLHFNAPTDVAWDEKTGDLFVSDGYGNHRIVKFDRQGAFVKSWGTGGSGQGQFKIPHNILIGPDRLLYVADRGNGRIQVFTLNGEYVRSFPTISQPFSLSHHGSDSLVVGFAAGAEHGFAVYALTGELKRQYGQKGSGIGEIVTPHAVVCNPVTREWIVGGAGDRKVMFLPAGCFDK